MYLFDASSIVNLVKRGVLKPLAAGATISLAVYEAVSAVWKEYHLLGRVDWRAAAEWVAILAEVFATIPVYSLSDLGAGRGINRCAQRSGRRRHHGLRCFLRLRSEGDETGAGD